MLSYLARELESEWMEAGRTVFEEGEKGDKFYVLARGKVEVVAAEGERIAVLSDGDFFGEIALVNDAPRSATVRTLTPCTFLTMSHSRFHRLLDEVEELRIAIEFVAGQRSEAR